MTEKRLPSYPLAVIKAAFAAAESLNRTFVAVQGAGSLGMDNAAVVAVVQGLTSGDFDKSMTSYADHTVWQDVYKLSIGNKRVYIKFTQNAQKEFLLISFKEA